MKKQIKRRMAMTMAMIMSVSGLSVTKGPQDTYATNSEPAVQNTAYASTENKEIPLQTASGRDENYVQEIDGTWLFGGQNMTVANELKADYTSWESVTIPHTWNAADGEDGGGNYKRCAYWYHKDIEIDSTMLNQRIYIEFLGANQKTDLYVNGTKVGDTHKGGYTAFRYDITDAVKEGTNVLDVKVDNTYDQSIAPISGDFNMYGGIYRRVYLVAVDDVHVDLNDHGSSGLFLTTGNMRSKEAPEDLGKFNIKANLENSSDSAATVEVVATVKGNHAPEPITKEIMIPANSSITFNEDCIIENPTLWEGVSYEKNEENENAGYQYTVSLEIKKDGNVIDKVEDKLGFRYFWIDSEEGFYLNGEKYPLRGVNRHSFRATVGSAMTEQQHAQDMDIMLDLGINTVRLCHYPQTDYFYDLCDENGIIVWTEIPVVNEIRDTDEFKAITKQQLTELISQQYNRPSVCFWGLENEIGNGQSLTNATANANLAAAKKFLYDLDELAKTLDTTGRFTTQALNRDYGMDQNNPDSVNTNFDDNTGWKSDVVAWNIYPGWYPDANFYGTFEDVMVRKTALDSRSMGISEYGWGANVNQHEANPKLGVNNLSSGGTWHPEEYQNLMNEEAIDYINNHDELWGTYYWALFDFAVDSRNEGSQVALNDKGLVTADRKTKKDSFYLYKANWNKKDSFTYITSRRWTNRDSAQTYIKVYSNCDEVELFINDKSLGKMQALGNGVFYMENVALAVGDVNVKAVGTCAGDTAEYVDTCQWSRALSTKPDLESEQFPVDTTSKTIIVENDVTFEQFSEAVKGINNAVYKVYDGDNEVTNKDTVIVPGMTIHVVAEDGKTEADYTVISSNLCIGKSITATSNETGNVPENAVDGNSATRWVASSGAYPQAVTIDLEKSYFLGDITLDWDDRNGARYYKYYVSVSEDGKNYTELIDQRNNTVSSSFSDTLMFTKARYIKVTVTGCNQAGWATLYEIKANGYMISSDVYTIDESHQLILLDEFPQTGLAEGVFESNIVVDGNYKYRINLSSGWIKEGNTVDILDENGNVVTTWTICSKDNKEAYYKEVVATKVALNTTEKTMGVDETFQLTTTVLPMNTTDKTVTYTSSNDKVASVSGTGLVSAKSEGNAAITVKTKNGKTAILQVIVKDYSKTAPVISMHFDDSSEVELHGKATVVADPDNNNNKALLVDSTAGGFNASYAIAKTDLSQYNFSEGITVSMKVRPTANASDWNYLFAVGQTKSSGKFMYCDGTIGFIARHGDPYEAHFPGTGWADGNTVNSDYQFFQNGKNANKWYRLTYVYGKNEIAIYVDGVLACKWGESSINSVLKTLNQGHLVLGAGASEAELENFGGYIDDVYVFDTALDEAAVNYIENIEQNTKPDTNTRPSVKPSNQTDKVDEVIKTNKTKKVTAKVAGFPTSKITLVVKKKAKIITKVVPSGSEPVTYKSSKTKVATVDTKGVIRAKKAGTTVIVVRSGAKQAKVTVKVVKKAKVNKKLKLKKTKLTGKKGKSVSIQIASITKDTTDKVTYKVTTGKKIAKVDSMGVVTGLKKGTAVILVKCGKIKKKVTIKVK